jgi:hypothetical protein
VTTKSIYDRCKNKENVVFLQKDKLVMNKKIYDLEFLQENYMLQLSDRRLDNPTVNDHVSHQQEFHRQNNEVNVQRDGLSGTHMEEGQESLLQNQQEKMEGSRQLT